LQSDEARPFLDCGAKNLVAAQLINRGIAVGKHRDNSVAGDQILLQNQGCS